MLICHFGLGFWLFVGLFFETRSHHGAQTIPASTIQVLGSEGHHHTWPTPPAPPSHTAPGLTVPSMLLNGGKAPSHGTSDPTHRAWHEREANNSNSCQEMSFVGQKTILTH